MLKATLSLILAGTLTLALPLTPVSAQNAAAPEAAQLAKLKAKFAKFGTGN